MLGRTASPAIPAVSSHVGTPAGAGAANANMPVAQSASVAMEAVNVAARLPVEACVKLSVIYVPATL